jgi:NAD(P)-dependent dehydrogenase (short-subunit alcohol dehydrogenase family)
VELGLSGRCAIVTGGSKGLGRAIALELAAEGVSVAICSRHPAELEPVLAEIEALGVKAYGARADVTSAHDMETFIAAAAEHLGGLDILVNNAGGARPGRFESLTDDDWYADLDTKLFSIIRCVRSALPHFRARGGGRVINIGAVQARSPDPVFCATTTIRAAGLNLTKVLAQQYAAENILVNAVNIGLVTTPQWDNIRKRTSPDATLEAFTTSLAQREVPLGRFGRPDEVSGLVAFLVSDRATYLTGTSIDVSGGMGRYV